MCATRFPPCRCPFPPAHVSGPGRGSLAAGPPHPEPPSPCGARDAAEAETS